MFTGGSACLFADGLKYTYKVSLGCLFRATSASIFLGWFKVSSRLVWGLLGIDLG